MKRKILVLLLAVVTLFSLSACKKEDIKENEKSFHFGDIHLNTYENKYYGLSAEFEEDWIVYSENEILEMNDILLDEEITEENIAIGDVLVDLIAYDYNSDDSVSVYAEKIGENSSVDIEAKAEIEKSDYEEFLTSAEYTDVKTSVSKREFLGEERICVNATAKLNDADIYFTTVYLETSDYLISLEVSSMNESGAENILSCFDATE